MNRFFGLLVMVLLVSCGVTDHDIKVKKWISTKSEQESIFLQLVKRTDKLAPGSSYDNRDSAEFMPYYTERMKLHDFANYYMNDSVRYFQLYRIVPSLYKEKIAIAGRYRTGANGEITEFEEVYITPKMKQEDLDEKAGELFRELVENGNVQEYMGQRAFIDFPDSLNVYNKQTQRWDFKYAQWFAK